MPSLNVAGLPSNRLAYTNAVFVPPALSQLVRPTFRDAAFVELNQGLVYEIRCNDDIEANSLGMSALHRSATHVSQGDVIKVAPFAVPSDANFNMAFLHLEASLLSRQSMELEEDDLIDHIMDKLYHLVFSVGQILVTEYHGSSIKILVSNLEIADIGGSSGLGDVIGVIPRQLTRVCAVPEYAVPRGVILEGTTVVSIDVSKRDQFLTLRKSRQAARNNILRPSFKFADMGIGGLDQEFGQIFRRAFASRTFPPQVIEKLGISHVRGMLLHGPPGTGKTLIARQIGKMLHGREPKVVNGPEILNKYVGASEENIRKLFADAEADYQQNGESADLHIIIFDEIDAICKQRGSMNSGTGVHDTVVNQLLSKIDGVNSLNNILVIGMTNRKDMIDEALLRPGRLEVHVEIGLPDELGRQDILKIHTKSMSDNGCLGSDVDLTLLASKTKNFSGAELAGLVKSATSFSLYGNVDVTSADSVAVRALENVMVCMDHFEQALLEIVPSFGVSEEELSSCVRGGMVDTGPSFRRVLHAGRTFVDQVKNSSRTPLLSVLLRGDVGCGKTALAAQLGLDSDVPFVKLISPEDFVGFSDSSKVSAIKKIFQDAYKSPISLVILDNIERLLEYTAIGPRFSNAVLQALLVLVKKNPPNEERRILIIGTTSNYEVLEDMGFGQAFNVVLEVPQIHSIEETVAVFRSLDVQVDSDELAKLVRTVEFPIGIKQLLLVIEMAVQASDGPVSADVFRQCLRDCNLGISPDFV